MGIVTASWFATTADNGSPLQRSEDLMVGISLSVPARVRRPDIVIPRLYPSAMLLTAFKSNKITWLEYTDVYNSMLQGFNADKTLAEFEHEAQLRLKSRIVLLCWEHEDKFCHRKLVAEWLNGGE